jgi:hypothetical protein
MHLDQQRSSSSKQSPKDGQQCLKDTTRTNASRMAKRSANATFSGQNNKTLIKKHT